MADNNHIKKLNDSESLIDILIQMEDFLDTLDLYVFKNWIDGEVVEGPDIKRYWVSMKLKYPFKKMPDPRGGLRLSKHGARIFFKQASEEKAEPIKQPGDYRPGQPGKPKMKKEKIWLVTIEIPRRFIDELSNNYDDYKGNLPINPEHIDAASDADIDKQDSFRQNDNEVDMPTDQNKGVQA